MRSGRRLRWGMGAAAVAAGLGMLACQSPRPVGGSGETPAAAHAGDGRAADDAARPFTPLNDPHLHNGHRVTERVFSGAQPEGEESFKSLAALGVKTIISVDGAKPDVEGAKKHGIRYVHLPITYSTVTGAQGRAIAKAIDELPGPVYVHCHHGKHRSAAAVAVACVMNGQLQPGEAEAVLRAFGTGENYTGLWEAAREARPLPPGELRTLEVEYVEAAKVPPIADAMVTIDFHAEHLKQVQKAGWMAPADHPDLDPAHEALQLREHLHELGRAEATAEEPADFRQMLAENEQGVRELEAILGATPVDAAAADAAMKRAMASCTACHRQYRD